MIQLVYAYNSQTNAFGYKQALPWGHCSEDLSNFKQVTTGTILVMGSNTFTSLPGKLPGRKHYVISRNEPVMENGSKPDKIFKSLEQAVKDITLDYSVIGGPNLLYEASKICDKIVVTQIQEYINSPADVFIDNDKITNGLYLEKEVRLHRIKKPNIKSINLMRYSRV